MVRIRKRTPEERTKPSDKLGFNANQYINKVLEPTFLPFYEELGGEDAGVQFIKDGSTIHTSKLANQWREENGVLVLKWAPNSPDLNPIENLWAILKQRLRRRFAMLDPSVRPHDADSLWEAVLEEWDRIEISLINRLCDSWLDRVKECISRKGGHTHY